MLNLDRPKFVEGRHVEPGPLVAGRVEVDAHGVLLEERRLTLVHRQVLVRLQVEQLQSETALLTAAFTTAKRRLDLAKGNARTGE